MTVAIRAAESSDAPVVAAMVREIAEHEDQSAHVHVDEGLWRSLLGRPDVTVLLAERDGTAVGYVSAVRRLHLWTGGDVLALDDLFVRPGSRSDGVGRQLMKALTEVAAPDRLVITWGVEPDNVDAQRFYRRLGARLRDKVLASWSPDAYAELTALPFEL
ncbi:GNAT family N-acetyltransferase [Petropleomorpha daqingensis]|uniref:GNAT superfamily N-acetyltransferase n=1 Tax=Petropleomorpha daqingensis TaxID=2026353 RepID=A0A853CLB6_9ACTN|nr:GNAT family N-acetyltransferase [Petropleomorpha daqingensis]NYJ07048.1 GNAT superfamily N-acetyltransferase [Petropleomorpha daqingensis]